MSEQPRIDSKILAFEEDKILRKKLKAFCQDFNLKGVVVTNRNRLLKTLKKNLNVGAIILCDQGENNQEVIQEDLPDKSPE